MSDHDVGWVSLLIDLKRNQSYSLAHLSDELINIDEVATNVHNGMDEGDVLGRLHDYLTGNETVIRNVFEKMDQDGNGMLDIHEICHLVGMIPGLDVSEVRYILIYIIEFKDTNKDGRLSFDEVCALVSNPGQTAK